MILEAGDVTVRYPARARPALDGVSCRVGAGELVAVVGPNGSGKTTLVRALSGLVPPEGGAVRVQAGRWRSGDGASSRGSSAWCRSARRWSSRSGWTKRSCSAVTRGSGRSPRRVRPIGRRCGPRSSGATWTRSPRARSTRSPAASGSGCGWPARWRRSRPSLVLDEPTASLDVRHEMELFELIRRLVDEGLAGLVITHQLNLAARFADRILLLSEGRVVAEGTPRRGPREARSAGSSGGRWR